MKFYDVIQFWPLSYKNEHLRGQSQTKLCKYSGDLKSGREKSVSFGMVRILNVLYQRYLKCLPQMPKKVSTIWKPDQIVQISNGQPFETWPSKRPIFEWFQISKGWISDPHCNTELFTNDPSVVKGGAHLLTSSTHFWIVPLDWFSLAHLALACLCLSPTVEFPCCILLLLVFESPLYWEKVLTKNVLATTAFNNNN